jgi:signal transduction histidine kinase
MGTIYQQVLEIVTTDPGNLIYHMVLAFSIAAAFQAALNLLRESAFPQGRRMVIGLGLLLGTRLLLFSAALPADFGLFDPHAVLPVADRGFMALGLVLILWLWLFPKTSRIADAACGLLGFLVITVTIFTQVWWIPLQPDVAFNATLVSKVWEVLALTLVAFSSLLLLFWKPNGWGYGVSMVAILGLGHLVQLLFPDVNSDYPGAVRLFEMAAFPLLWSIPNRFGLPSAKVERPATPAELTPRVEARPSIRIKPETFQAILALSDPTTPEDTCQKLAKLMAETMLADISLVLSSPNEKGELSIKCGYDLIQESYLASMTLDSKKIPLLVSAMKRTRPLRLPASSTSPDILKIGQLIGLGRTGHLLAAFVPSPEAGDPILGIILISPYTDRHWSRDDQAFLNKTAASLAPILQQTGYLGHLQGEFEKNKQALATTQKLLKETQSENAGLRSELANISNHALLEHDQEIKDLLTQQKSSQEIIDRLYIENKRLVGLTEDLAGSEETRPLASFQLQEELKLALSEIARLEKQLSEANQTLKDANFITNNPKALAENQLEVFTSVAQELRQPMSSISGYTDLLLAESVGILGALQRKFLERIKASIERMDILLADLFQIFNFEIQGLTLRLESVDLGNVIDEAIADTRSQFQERGIVLRVDLPEEMPHLHADQDALQQILIHLLKNAGTASPIDGEIFLRASIFKTEDSEEFVLMQVADQGGGIPKEDLPRVFSRLYRADNPLIQGIGETGVGLSIVKTLVEAHDGRIWVDTEQGKGSTFTLLMPLSNGTNHSNKLG